MMNITNPNITPSQNPPSGFTSNFENPYNYILLAKAVLGLCLASSSLFISMRIWSRFLIQRAHGWDDYSMIIAWASNVAWIGLCFHATRYGAGVYHLWDISLTHLFIFLKIANELEIIYNISIFFTKLSILLQLIRLLCPHRSGWTYYLLWLLIVSDGLFYFAINIVTIWSCNPRHKIWHPLEKGSCINLAAMLIIGAVVNFISDVSILVLPIWKVWRLQLSTAKKIGVTSIFATGLFACVASIMRLVATTRFIAIQNDVTLLVPAALWAEGEITSGIICGCLPSVPAIFRSFVPKVKSYLRSRSTKKTCLPSERKSAVDEYEYRYNPYIELEERSRSQFAKRLDDDGKPSIVLASNANAAHNRITA